MGPIERDVQLKVALLLIELKISDIFFICLAKSTSIYLYKNGPLCYVLNKVFIASSVACF